MDINKPHTHSIYHKELSFNIQYIEIIESYSMICDELFFKAKPSAANWSFGIFAIIRDIYYTFACLLGKFNFTKFSHITWSCNMFHKAVKKWFLLIIK